ncbi:MAG: glycosyltransferase family 2 protein [Pontiellaceae bacterium]|jgi:cellulose synthase/poly-beta-1,6-N-acetylglucosamine synthase-like glycosyltransferase|nr:glycosyltransferase family 2 protein [Pontiellaceae bacterium]
MNILNELIDGLATALFSLITVISVTYFITTLVSVLACRRKRSSPPVPDEKLPTVTVQITSRNELVALDCARCCMAFDYPENKLQILLGDDSNNLNVMQEIDHFAEHNPRVRVLRRNNRIGFKSGNLNHVNEHTTGEYILVMDSDFLPEPDFLRRLAAHAAADPGLAAVQARWHITDVHESLTTLLGSGIINVTHFIMLPLFDRFMKTCFLCGSAMLIKRQAMVEMKGWETKTMIEDVELTFRFFINGYRIAYCPDVTCDCEVPHTPGDLFRQQKRWAYGVVETALKHSAALYRSRKATLGNKIAATIVSSGYAVSFLAFISIMLGFVHMILLGVGNLDASLNDSVQGTAGNLWRIVVSCGALVATICAGFASGFGIHGAGKLIIASYTVGFIMLFHVSNGIVRAVLHLPIDWVPPKKHGR